MLGEVVAVLEAMTMQNDIVATRPDKVTQNYVKHGRGREAQSALAQWDGYNRPEIGGET